MRYPLLPRLLVGLLGIVVLVQGAFTALDLDADGLHRTALAHWLVAAAFAAFLVVLAVVPWEVESLAPRGSPLDLRRGSHYGAVVAGAGALVVVLGMAGLVDTLRLIESGAEGLGEETQQAVLAGLAYNAVVLVAAPIVWVAAMHPGAPVFRLLGLRREGSVRAFLVGSVFAFLAILVVAAAITVAVRLTGLQLPVNTRAVGIASALAPWAAVVVALASGITEELFFRGWLQPRIGLVPQAIVFAAAHLNYLHVGEVVAVLVLGVAFGLLYRATKNLWSAVGAHATFNLVMLLAAGAA